MEMAYSKGWKITKRAEEDLGFPLMEGSRGGSHGGKTTLTEEGKEFLEKYEKFLEEVEESTKKTFEKIFLRLSGLMAALLFARIRNIDKVCLML